MKRNLILVFSMLLAATFSFAQTGQTMRKDAATTTKTKQKREQSGKNGSRTNRDKLTPSSSNSAVSPPPVTTAPVAARKAQAVEPSYASGGDRMDLNSASESQLAALPGVGAAKAAKIVAMRPYTGKNQLVSKGILSAEEYAAIKEQIIAHHVKK